MKRIYFIGETMGVGKRLPDTKKVKNAVFFDAGRSEWISKRCE